MTSFLHFKSNVFLAPMAGITDAPMRNIVYGKCKDKVNIISEMVAINALSRKNAKTYKIADVRGEPYPVIVQLVGASPELFADAAQLAVELGASAIDINMGCPVRKITTTGAGSALMKDIKSAEQIIKAVKNAINLDVSVKFRKGWDENSINAVDFAKMCQDCGASYVTIHGRTRAQGYSGVADWKIIADVKNSLNIPVIGNGDINSVYDAKEMIRQTGVNGVMIGRAALGNPWLLGQIFDYLQTSKQPDKISTEEILNTVLYHVELLKKYYDEKLAVALSRKYVCWYSKNFYDAKKFRENYMKITDYQNAIEEIKQYFTLAVREEK
ncbi:MAG: tRNA dihydrouridine synthase DusB [Alphaproteobacteria bacterium]|nr:tRNA dihydrouridine synthase DusB [Alphaproteobacteria bacterium]